MKVVNHMAHHPSTRGKDRMTKDENKSKNKRTSHLLNIQHQA